MPPANPHQLELLEWRGEAPGRPLLGSETIHFPASDTRGPASDTEALMNLDLDCKREREGCGHCQCLREGCSLTSCESLSLDWGPQPFAFAKCPHSLQRLLYVPVVWSLPLGSEVRALKTEALLPDGAGGGCIPRGARSWSLFPCARSSQPVFSVVRCLGVFVCPMSLYMSKGDGGGDR